MVNIVAILSGAFGLYKTFEGKLFLENYSFFSEEAVETMTRNGGYPTIWVPLFNSLLIALSVTILVVIVSTLAGYFISRFNFRGRKQCLQGLIILHSFPAHSLTIPIFLLMYWLGLLDRTITVVFVLTALELPFAIYIIKGFFDGVPWSIEMSAMTDGATRFQAFYKVVLPMIKNGAVAISVFAFIKGWGEYIFVSTLMISNENWMMSTYLYIIADETKDINYGLLAAVSVIYLLPTLIMYLLAQKQLSQLNISGVKG
ncbi:MAG: carbohydrate ABC transporter permease [Proteobacteria bacterium]|nr:carbohydrate ABC transporter permease [Pseudomonadota bacterium]